MDSPLAKKRNYVSSESVFLQALDAPHDIPLEEPRAGVGHVVVLNQGGHVRESDLER